MFRQLEAEEERARHRVAADDLLADVEAACRGEIDPIVQSEFCQVRMRSFSDGQALWYACERCFALVTYPG